MEQAKSAWSRLGWVAIVLFAAASLSSVVFPRIQGTILGYFTEAWWQQIDHGEVPLECGGAMRMTIRGARFHTAIHSRWTNALVVTGGDCHLEIVDSDLEALPGYLTLSVGGGARVVVRGGRLGGHVSVGGDARLEVHDATIDGPITTGGNGRMILVGGRLNGSLTTGAASRVEIQGTQVSGRVEDVMGNVVYSAPGQ